jgi:hypothetical protein
MNGNQWARLLGYVTGLVNQELLLQNELSFAIIAPARSSLTWNRLRTNNRSTCQPFSCLSFDSSDSC